MHDCFHWLNRDESIEVVIVSSGSDSECDDVIITSCTSKDDDVVLC